MADNKNKKEKATVPFVPKIALVFDFDGTLGPDVLDMLLEECGQDPDVFRKEHIDPYIDEGFEVLLAVCRGLIDESETMGLTEDTFKTIGARLKPFEGVKDTFKELIEKAQAILPELEVEFYLISSGLIQVMENSVLAQYFNEMWGTRLYFEDKKPVFAKNIMTHPEKQRYILQLAKGMGVDGPNAPADVFTDIPLHDYYIPIDQIVYTGDGLSDMPAFQLMHQYGGLAIGVVNEDKVEDWKGYEKLSNDRKVQNLAKADYKEGSELRKSLVLAVESLAKKIALKKLGSGE
jgi:phosphoglycolate phosphatase-like HAD superfamily hydrolase